MKLKKILCLIMCLSLFVLIFINPIFADNTYYENLKSQPVDIGYNVSYSSMDSTPNIITKYYIKLTITTNLDDSILFRYEYNDGNEVTQINRWFISYENGTLSTNIWSNNEYYSVVYPYFTMNVNVGDVLYIPIYIYNVDTILLTYNVGQNRINFAIYTSTTLSQDQLLQEYFNAGYVNGYDLGYNQGLTDYPGARDDWNLVQHIEHAIGFFIGDEYAQYVTPFAISFTILMAYFIFIRWIFLFGKSQKALKVADIVVIVACICVMAVMYINMLTINIQNTNISESIESSSEVIRSFVPDHVYKYVDDTKVDSVYRIVDDVRIGG